MSKVEVLAPPVVSPRKRNTSFVHRRPILFSSLILSICIALYITSHPVAPHGPRSRRYHNETIHWHTCADLDHDFECGTIHVPMDHWHGNPSNRTFSIPLMRLRGNAGSQNVLLNPGGPGVSGVEDLRDRGRELQRIVGREFHLVSFDPRGTGGSRPLASCYPDDVDPQLRKEPRSSDVELDSRDIYAWTQNYVQACKENSPFGHHVNTPQTATDMNAILDALGQEKLLYWGFSYGTILGQTYATMYPERVQRLIIDGVANIIDWYANRFDFDALYDAERVLYGFYDKCVEAGPACSLAALAENNYILRGKIELLLDALKEQPLSVYINASTYGVLTYENILYDGIYPALYHPQEWSTLADNLSQLISGNATAAFLAYGHGVDWIDNDFVTMNDGMTTPVFWPEDRASMVELLKPYVHNSPFGPSAIAAHYKRQQWLFKKLYEFQPKSEVHTAHPLLILSTTYDPVCPLKSALAARDIFSGSQVVELKGYGHCSYAMPSSCMDGYVRRYLTLGELPAEHALCEVDGPYFAS